MLLSEAFDRYKADVIIFSNQSAKTEENHEVAKKSILSFLGDLEVATLTFEDVRKWKQWLDDGRSAETVRNYVIKLRVVLRHLKGLQIQSLDPEVIPVPKRTDKVPNFITPDQVRILINSTDRVKNKCIISFLYASAIRVSELCSLDRSSIHDMSFTVVGKGGKARLCFIDQRTQTLLDKYLATRDDNHPALFLSDSGKRITPGVIQETFKYARKRSGIECNPHTMRHSFSTDFLRNNGNMRYLQAILGHASLQTTQMYTHVVDEDLRKVYNMHHTA